MAASALLQRSEAIKQRSEAIKQRDIARQKSLTAERTVEFVKSIFTVSDPSEARGASITAREILDRGAVSIQQGLEREPTVKAELGTTLGEVYTNLGLLHDGDRLIPADADLAGRHAFDKGASISGSWRSQSLAG